MKTETVKGVLRKAKPKDAVKIHELVNEYAKEGLLLPLSLNKLYDNIRDFWVYEEGGEIVGCAALHIVWEDLAEIRSLAVKREHHKKGVGKKLVLRCLEEAKEYDLKRVFVLTYQVEFFKKLGFRELDKRLLPHKVWSDCINCPKFPTCDETAMIRELD
ncbi:MAG TPA: N-acetyltransferase [Aquificales bacterium]|nr:N-acetyltransferase [Aquificales bacterium]